MESLWEKITDLDKLKYASQAEQPIVKSQFRMKKNALSSQKTSIQIHLYASLILFICANNPKAKISLTPEVQYQLSSENNQLIIHKNEKSIQLRLNDSENLNKWAKALTKLGITERYPLRSSQPQSSLGRKLSTCPTDPSDSPLNKLTTSSTSSHFNYCRDSQSSTSSQRSLCTQITSNSQSSSFKINDNQEQTITLSLSPSDSTCYSSISTPSQSESSKCNTKQTSCNKNGKRNNQKLNSKRRASLQENIYAAPETLKPSMEHFIINTTYLYRKACTNYFQYLTNLRGLERIPEEQECCD